MNKICESAPQLQGLVPYDPKYIPADAMLSANENPQDVAAEIREKIAEAVAQVPLNRYPDPLANALRDQIAEANGLDRDWVLIGNGGDELLFNTALAWGGEGRAFLNMPPTFSVYEANARLTNTRVINVPRLAEKNFAIDESAVLQAVQNSENNITFTIVTSPNNPTGLRANEQFIEQLLDATDALVMVDEAYFEFSRETVRPLLEKHKNLVILRTFSKAFSLAGVRLGYIFAHPEVIREYLKVRQPYSVDAVSQAVAGVVYKNRSAFEPGIQAIISQREYMQEQMAKIPGVTTEPSDSNWILFHIENAAECWQYLYDGGVLVRDFSRAPMLENMLRVTIGTPEQNEMFLTLLGQFVQKQA
jgi:histidinol-phosphate aminotransferase